MTDKANEEVLADVRERLSYVMTTKEQAVSQTLAFTEEALGHIGELHALLNLWQQSAGRAESMGIEFFPQAAAMLDQVQARLMDVLMAQGYQDLTGQVLRRVMDDLAHVALSPTQPRQDAPTEATGLGPAALARENSNRAQSQGDVDDILSQLGL